MPSSPASQATEEAANVVAPAFICAGNPLDCIVLCARLLVCPVALTVPSFQFISRLIPRPLRGRVRQLGLKPYHHPGLTYSLNEEAIAASVHFFAPGKGGRVVDHYRRYFGSDKVETFLRWYFARVAFAILTDLHLLQAGRPTAEVLVVDDPFARFVVGRFQKAEGNRLRVRWVPSIGGLVALAWYYVWLLRELLRRGVSVSARRPRFAFCAEGIQGVHREVLRDDLFVDGRRIKAADVLVATISGDELLEQAGKECAERGYQCADQMTLPLRLRGPGAGLVPFFVSGPVLDYLRLLLDGKRHLLPAFLYFRRDGLTTASILGSFDVGAFVLTTDWGDIPRTMIANKLGARTCLIELSEISSIKDRHSGLLAHNLLCQWGAMPKEVHEKFQCIDRYLLSGCPFKESFARFRARRGELRASLGLGQEKVVTFFLTSFAEWIHFGEAMVLRFLGALERCCEENPDTTFLLKPKFEKRADQQLPAHSLDGLTSRSNFKFILGWRRDPEAAIAISDLVVTMGMTTPSAIALVCGVDALYFDDTLPGHPLAGRFKDSIVFDDGDRLAEQVKRVISGESRIVEMVPAEMLEGLDAHRDDAALERIRDALLELVARP